MEQLLTVLQKQQHILNKLIGISKQEQEAIISRNTELLKISLTDKEQLVQQLNLLENKRSALTANHTFSTLAAAVGEQADLLESLRHSLKNDIQELKNLTTTNALLLKTELAYFNVVKDALGLQSTHYNDKGTITKKDADQLSVVSRRA